MCVKRSKERRANREFKECPDKMERMARMVETEHQVPMVSMGPMGYACPTRCSRVPKEKRETRGKMVNEVPRERASKVRREFQDEMGATERMALMVAMEQTVEMERMVCKAPLETRVEEAMQLSRM
jgi:hypothetical protein